MNTAQREVFEFLKHRIKDEHNLRLSDPSPAFFEAMESHGLLTLLYPQMSEWWLDIQWCKKIQRHVISVSARNLIRIQQMAQVLEAFHARGIPVIVLKGLSLARLYPKPELRGMCDLDILAAPEHWEDAKQTLLAHGLRQLEADEFNPLHVAFGKDGHFLVELHRNLIHDRYLSGRNSEDWIRRLWENRKITGCLGLKFFALSWEDELILQVVHFANHFVYMGARIRQLFETALIIRYNYLDWGYIAHTLKGLGLLEFGCLFLTACALFFDIPVAPDLLMEETKVAERFMSDLLDYHCFEKTMGDFNGWIDVLARFPWIIRHPLLWPAGWAIELKSQLKLHGPKTKIVFSNALRNIKAMTRRMKIIKTYLAPG